MKRVLLLNGSLRGRKSSSLSFLRDVQRRLERAGIATESATVIAQPGQKYSREWLRAMAESDAVVIAFPLFCYSTPGALTRFMEEYDDFVRTGGACPGKPKLYAIVNSGFPDPVVCDEARRVMRGFAARAGLDHRCSIAVTSGPVTAMAKNVPLLHRRLKRAYAAMAKDIRCGGTETMRDVSVTPVLPRWMIIRVKDRYEKKFA